MQLVGWLGFALIQLFYAPQLIKTIRSKEVGGFSLSAWIILWLGLLFYLVYSLLRRDTVFIVGNAAGLLQTSLMIGLIFRYRKPA